jgi:aldose 1-epimerase
MKIINALFVTVLLASMSACNNGSTNETPVSATTDSPVVKSNGALDKKLFESTVDGKQTDLYFLKNHNGMQAAITNYGGRLVSLLVPDKDGKLTDVVVGFKSVQDYENSTEPYFGATIGRFGNRIAKGKFTLDGKQYTLFTNNGANTLHGGKKGYWN